MFKLHSTVGLVFNSEDLKEIYEPIVKQFGFEYDSYLDRDKRGLVWTKLYDEYTDNSELWPTMVIRESGADPCPSSEEATYFSTSLWWENTVGPGFMIYANPNEFEFGPSEDVEDLIYVMREAQKEVNEVLEKCRQQLAAKLKEIETNLIKEAEKR